MEDCDKARCIHIVLERASEPGKFELVYYPCNGDTGKCAADTSAPAYKREPFPKPKPESAKA